MVGQNLGLTGRSGSYEDPTSVIRGITETWFTEYTQASMANVNNFTKQQSVYRRIRNWALMVNDLQISIGCALARYRRNRIYNSYLVCNYSRGHVSGPIYEAGAIASGCTTGQNSFYAGLCSSNEVINPNP